MTIRKTFAIDYNFQLKNLVVSGCSFTSNTSEDCAVSWPYYLRDLGGFDKVISTALPGAGNYHIAKSLQWTIETQQPDPDNSLIIVMWSGNDRDDIIVNSEFIKKDYLKKESAASKFDFSENVGSGITGGISGESNLNLHFFKDLNYIKSKKSRAIENYLIISSLWQYLMSHNYKFLFLNYLDLSLPNRTLDFDITEYLPQSLINKYRSFFSNVPNIYSWCLEKDLLWHDDFHPSPDGHLHWTRNALIPSLKSIL